MAIRIDTALQMMPSRAQRQMDDEMSFGGYPSGRGPISEAVMPLNRELIKRADHIQHLSNSVRILTAELAEQAAEIATLRAAATALVKAKGRYHTELAYKALEAALKGTV